jgi:hypothetical protein
MVPINRPASTCESSAPDRKNMVTAVAAIRRAVPVSGCSSIRPVTAPSKTANGTRPYVTSRILSPLDANHAAM